MNWMVEALIYIAAGFVLGVLVAKLLCCFTGDKE